MALPVEAVVADGTSDSPSAGHGRFHPASKCSPYIAKTRLGHEPRARGPHQHPASPEATAILPEGMQPLRQRTVLPSATPALRGSVR